MDDLTLAFLERWTDENVTATPPGDEQAEAERLAAACIEDAAQEGISAEELLEITGELVDEQDLVSYFESAIQKITLEELDDVSSDDD